MTEKLGPMIVVVGPTASGKSALAVEIAKRVGGEVVSADSMQIYRGMNIGSAKVTDAEMCGVPHHMLDFVPPEQGYSVAQYREDALQCIKDIYERGKVPVLCGGTGLYVNSLLYPLVFSDAPSKPEVRERLQNKMDTVGNAAMHDWLREVDPIAAERIHPNNGKRVIRALEVYEITGRPFSSFDQSAYMEKQLAFDVWAWVGLQWPKALLDDRIARRVHIMLKNGLIREVRALRELGLSAEHQSMQGLGYKQMFPYLEGKASLDETTDEIILRTRQYAKRQMTWFRREERIRWIDASKYDTVNQTDIVMKMIAEERNG